MADFAVRIESSFYARQAKPGECIRKKIGNNRQQQRKSDQIALSAAMGQRAKYSYPMVSASRPITAADLGTWIPGYLRSRVLLHLAALQQIPISAPPFLKDRCLGAELSVRLERCLANADCGFLGDVLALDNPLKIKNFGRGTLYEIEGLLRHLDAWLSGPQSPAPFSASTLFLRFKDFNFRSSDGLLAHSEASAVILDRLGDPFAQVEILSPSVPVNLLPRLPEDLKAKLAGHIGALKDEPIVKGKGGRYSVLGFPLSVRLANFLLDAGFATLEDCLLDTRAMRYMGRPQTFLEFVGVLWQVVDNLDGRK